MDAKEHNDWLSDYFAAFPSTVKWLTGIEDQIQHGGAGTKATLLKWREVLEDTDLEDALKVTERMMCGAIEPVHNFDRENTPAIVKRLAAEEYKKRTFTLAPATSPNRRHDCPYCLDTMYVSVYTEKAMRLMRQLKFPGFDDNPPPKPGTKDGLYMTDMMPCCCDRATAVREHRESKIKESRDRGAVVDSVTPILCHRGQPFHPANMEHLKEQIEEQSTIEKSGKPKGGDFEAFNQGTLLENEF